MPDDWEEQKRQAQSPFHDELQGREPQSATAAEPGQKPMNEHEALGLAIDALKQVPNHELQGAITGDYSEVRNLLPALEDVYQREQEILREQEWQQWVQGPSVLEPERDIEPDL